MSVLLTRKAVLQGVIETSYNVAATVGVGDGFLVDNPAFTIKPKVLERQFVREDLSPLPFIIGQKIASMEFETELRGNGAQNSGLSINAPLISRLFRACGYHQGQRPGGAVKGPFDQGQPNNEVTWTAASGTQAAQLFTATGEPNDGDILTVGGFAYKWKTALTPTVGEVLIGATEATALANMAAAITGGAGSGTLYAAGTLPNADVVTSNTGTTLTATAAHSGTYGNAIAVSYTPSGSSEGAWGAATLTGGLNVGSNTDVIAYYLTCTVGGASGAAQIAVTSDTTGEALVATTVTSGSPLTVGTKGLTVTPTFTGSLVAGQAWTVWLMPPGLSFDPISDNFESITLVLHKDGVLHTMPGAYGTFDITAQSGDYAKVKWTFTGTYVEPTDDPNPAPIFERTLPSQVQLARLRINAFNAIVEKFSFNQMNDIQVRQDVSSSDGYVGTRVVGRKPEGGINPEADLVANNDFWGQMSAAQCMPFQMRVGSVAGNTVWVIAPNTQYSGLTYGDRSGILVYDAGMRFARSLGNDEICFYFS